MQNLPRDLSILIAVVFFAASAFAADPTITALSPTSASVGQPMTLTVNGTNFVSGSIVKWNGSSRTTTYVSATVIRASIPSSDVTATGTALITVANPAPALLSNAVSLPIVNPAPTIASLSPSSVFVGAAGFDMTLSGTGFISSSVVQWGGQNRPTTYVSASQIKATISAGDVAQTGTTNITVTNPTPGGGTSAARTFTVNNPVPNLTAIFPTTATTGGPDFILEVQGANYVVGAVVKWKGSARTTTFISSTLLRAAIPAADLAAAGTAAVTVANPTPGGGASTSVNFTVSNPVPAVTSLSPSSATALGTAFTLTVNGSGFVSGASIQWNGVNRTTLYVSPTQLTVALSAADIATGGIAKVGVVNAAPGGGNSTTQDFTINNPVPTISTLTPASANAGGLGFSLTVDGTNFVTTSVVCWNGAPRATTRTGATRLVATILDTDIAVTGTANVTVVSPSPAGGTSVAQTFTIIDNPVPVLTSLSPASTTIASPGFALTLNGSGFVVGSVVKWNGSTRATTYVNGTTLTAQILNSDLTSSGSNDVTVFNPLPGGGTSAIQTFTVFDNPLPAITSISPVSTTVNSAGVTITINGSNFVPSSVVNWNALPRTTTFVSSTRLTVAIPAGDLLATGTASITVTNPSPGGGLSGVASFAVNNPAPTLSSIGPTFAIVNDPSFTLAVTGGNFVAGSVVRWNGSDRVTNYVSRTQLTATIKVSDLAAVGSFAITVFNPTPGGGTSTSRSFTVRGYPLPSISSLTPSSATAGGAGFTLTVKGTNFIPLSVINWNGFAFPTTYVSATQLTAPITPTEIAMGGSGSVTVTNPTPGGGTSSVQTFTINNPVPTISDIAPTTKAASSPGFTLTVNGANFVSTSKVRWNAAYRTTTFVSPTQLTADIPASDLATGTIAAISVYTPAPGGGISPAPPSFTVTVNNPVPSIVSLSPTSVTIGTTGLSLTVNGTNFVPGSVVFWGGVAKTTTYVDGTQITASIPSSDLVSTADVNVTVVNPAPSGGTSASAVVSVVNPVPTLSSISPTAVTALGSTFTLTVNGTNFLPISMVRWNGVNRPTTWVNATRMTATIDATDIASSGTANVTVFTSTPAGGTSAAQVLTINNPVPTLTSMGPSSAAAGGAGFTLTVQGSNLVNGSTVRWNGSDRVTTYVSGTRLSAAITAADIASAGSATVTVFNSTPGGGTSAGLTFTVLASSLVPSIAAITPSSTAAGSSAFKLQVDGVNFVAGSVVRWNGLDRVTTVLSSTQLEAAILASDVTSVGTASVTVFNPAPGGGTSGAKNFVVNSNPSPSIGSLSPASTLVGSGDTVLTINGSSLNTTSVAYWNAVPLATSYVSATKITALIPAAKLSAVGTAAITVVNPAPGGGTSGSQPFTISPYPAPNLTTLNPSSQVVGSGLLTLSVTGSNFLPVSVVRWNGSDRPTMYVSGTQLTATISAGDMNVLGTVSVTVFNPPPGGGESASRTFTVNNPVPTVSTPLTPAVVIAGSPDFTLFVDGTNFVPGSLVKWKGAVRTTTYFSATRLTADIPAADVITGGTAAVTVTNPTPGGGTSNNVNFTIENPEPSITSIVPISANAGDLGIALEINGTGFVGTSAVRWNSASRSTNFVSSTKLTASITTGDLAVGGTFPVVVFNPSPGGDTSSSRTFTVFYPAPTLTSISPTSAVINDSALTLTVNGDNFFSGAVVTWNDDPRTTVYTSRTKLQVTIPAGDLDSLGTATVKVINPTPGGGTTSGATFTINSYPVPAITGLSSTSTTVNSPGFTLTVDGTNFYSGATVQWDGADRVTTFVSSTRLTALIPDTDLTAVGAANVTVVNPAPGGGSSAPVVFSIVANPVPGALTLSPTFTLAGSSSVTLTVNGSNFVPDSVVQWNGADRTTTFFSAIKLTAVIPAADVALAGTANVTVTSPSPGGGVSPAAVFTINNKVPTLTSVFPTTAELDSPQFNLSLTGTNFVATSTVLWNGASRPTTYVGAAQLTALISASDLVAAGTVNVTVNSPTPGGGTTVARTLTVNNPLPQIGSISPTSGSVGGAAFTLTVNGQDFVNGAVVQWGGQNRTTTFVSTTQLQASITVADMSGWGSVEVTVANPAPGGGTSAAAIFQRIGNPVPTIGSLAPATVTPGSGAFTLTVNGTNFVAGSVVRWNGVDRATTFVNSTQVTAAILAGDVLLAGTANVTVFNPTPGGGTSAPATFTMGYPVPVLTSLSPTTCAPGSSGFTLTLNGSALQANSVVRWNGADRVTTYVSGTRLTAQILAADVSAASNILVTVYTPGPGGGTSQTATFTVANPVPSIASISPTGVVPGAAGFTLTVNGSGFVASSVVQWNGADRVTAYMSAAQLTATIPAGDVATQGTAAVTVVTPSPGGGTSNSVNFAIQPRYSLALTVTPLAGGTITAVPSPDLDTKYAVGTVVNLTANLANGYLFTGWTGDVVSAQTTIQVTMDGNHAVTANFLWDNVAPIIDSLPWASPNPVEFPGTTAVHVLAHDPDSGPSPLSYTWSKDSGPGTVTFVPNGTAAAQDSVATFSAAGAYVLRVTVSDGNKTDTDTVFVTVNAATPPSAISLSASLVSMFTKFGVAGASAIGEYSASFVAGNGVDGVTSTDWNGPFRSVVQEEWYRVDLGVVKSVGKVRILPRGDYPLLMPGSFVLEGSVDGVSYTTMKVESGYVGQSGVWYEGTFSAANVRYVRLRGNTVSAYGVKSMGFAEFEVWGPQGQGVQLSWTAPGDNGAVGTATSYEVRYSISGVISDETAWSAATAISGAPIPSVAGTAQSMTIPASALPGEATLYFGLRAVDAVGNRGGLSNSPSVVMPGIAPAAVANLSVSNPTANGFTVSFTAVGDDGNVGAATTYDVRCSTSPLTELNWAVATVLTGEPAPKVAGLSEIFAVSGAQEDTTYYVGIKVADEMGNWSGLSNVVSIKTADVTAPSAVGNLSVGVVTLGTLVKFGVVGASATGEYSASFVAGNGVDGVMSTDWNGPFRSVVQEEWYRVDLGIVKSVGKVRILPRGSYPLLMPGSFVLEGSVDGVSYTTMKVESGYVGQSGVWYEGTFSAANVRYVRLRGNTVSAYGVKSMGFAEFEVWGLDPKLSIVGASATGEYSASFVAGNGVDGVTSTDWNGPFRSVVQEEWYRVDLGIVKSVGKVRILPRGSYPLLMPGSFVLEGSVDGVSYTTMKVESGYVGQSGVWYEGTFSAANVRYVRLRGNTVSAYGVKSMGFAEFEVWGSQGQGVQLSWTAPGDNGALGTATSYEVRYSTSGAISDEMAWSAATAISGAPTPLVAGTAQSMTVPLTALGSPATGTVIYFCVRAKDEADLVGGVSEANITAP